jgi:hypothetical protein
VNLVVQKTHLDALQDTSRVPRFTAPNNDAEPDL